MRHGLLPALSLFLQPWLFFFFFQYSGDRNQLGVGEVGGGGVGTRLSAA